MSDRSGTTQVYVATWPEWEGHWRASPNGGRAPLWSRDASELYFVSGNRIMSVDASGGFPTPEPTELLRGDWDLVQNLNYDVNADGEFVFVRAPPGARTQLGYVANWVTQLGAGQGS